MVDRLLDGRELAQLLGVSQRTVEGWRGRGSGPLFVRVGRLARYCPEDVKQFLKANRAPHARESARNERPAEVERLNEREVERAAVIG